MITISPTGGIGNQLFQYAAGRALALYRNTELEIDTWWHCTAPLDAGKRPLLLHRLSLPVRWRTYAPHRLRGVNGLVNRLRQRFVVPAFRPIVTDEDRIARKTFFQAPSNAILSGYFQSLDYMGRYKERIRAEIYLARLASDEARSLATMLARDYWCAIQVRQGDYVGNPYFQVVDYAQYFETAINIVRADARNTHFIVFSDDPAWCREQPFFKDMAIHEPPAHGRQGDAIYLMSVCARQIISNSSYGWWGAFLAGDSGFSKVIAPKRWFRHAGTKEMGLALDSWTLL